MRRFLPPLPLALAWLALMALLGTTLALSFVSLGTGNIIVAMCVSVAKTAIVIFLFMKLAQSPRLAWVFAAAGLFWLLILFGLSGTDFLTRSGPPL
jgi:cytochrome c oxidase subunit 4